jgi:large subunit ribosomal protein L3
MTEKAAETAASGSVALNFGRGGILGVKAGMTTVYNEAKERVPVTVVDLQPCVVTQLRTKEKNGYQAVQVGYLSRKKPKNKAETGRLKALNGAKGFYHYAEVRLPESAKLEGVAVGAVLSPDFLKAGDFVDVTSVSKGKGFQGVMKRHNFSGGFKTHGASVCHRSPGSIGNRADPGRVYKGRKMAGRMGHKRVTVQNLQVVSVDAAKNLLVLKGAVPGPRSSILTIRRAVKKLK